MESRCLDSTVSVGPIEYIDVNGVRRHGALEDLPSDFHICKGSIGEYYIANDQAIYELENGLNSLLAAVSERLFKSPDHYYMLRSVLPLAITCGGLSHSVNVSSKQLESALNLADCEYLRKVVFFDDINNIADCVLETFGQASDALCDMFVEISNVNNGCFKDSEDGVFEVSSPDSHAAVGALESFVIHLYASLDITAKLLSEVEDIPLSLESFRRLSSRSMLYRKYASRNNRLFGASHHIATETWSKNYLEDIRNEIVHNRSLDPRATVFVQCEDHTVSSRWIVLPDAEENGRLSKWLNRRRFYSQNLRATAVLPQIYFEVSSELVHSIGFLEKEIRRENGELAGAAEEPALGYDELLSRLKLLYNGLGQSVSDND